MRPTPWGLLYLFLQNWSRESGLNRRPAPSLTPPLYIYKRARLYLYPADRWTPLSVVRARRYRRATVLPTTLKNVWALTVIRDSLVCHQKSGQGLRPTMALLYQLSYLGLTHLYILAEFRPFFNFASILLRDDRTILRHARELAL